MEAEMLVEDIRGHLTNALDAIDVLRDAEDPNHTPDACGVLACAVQEILDLL